MTIFWQNIALNGGSPKLAFKNWSCCVSPVCNIVMFGRYNSNRLMMVCADKLSWPTMINNVEATKNDQPLSWWTRSRDNCLLLVQAKKLVFDPISCVSSVQLVMVGINISLSRYCCCNGRVFRGEEWDYWNLLSQPLCATFHKCGIQSTLVPQHSLISSSLVQSEHELYSLSHSIGVCYNWS